MGNYNSQYESYYRSIVNKRNNKAHLYNVRDNVRSHKKNTKSNYLVKRLIQDLCGVLVMLIFVITCKVIVTDKTVAAYKYCKNVIETNYNYEFIVSKLESLCKNGSLQDNAIEVIDRIKAKALGGETIKDKIKEKFSIPIDGRVIDLKEKGINIETNGQGEIIASFNGRVKECGRDEKNKTYVLIDHGEGIETVYSNLDNIIVNKEDIVKKGDIIGKKIKNNKGYVHFEILFMGQNKNLEKNLEMK